MEAVVNAIQNLYTTSSGPHRQHANSQLIAWQKLPESWTIAFELLQLNVSI